MYKYIFGPVPSRRLGISLGIDLVPENSCNYNCIYCECGETTNLSIKRGSLVNIDHLILEIADVLKNIKPNYITFSGSGEPTLNSDLHEIIKRIKNIYPGKMALITNSSLLNNQDVLESLKNIDLIIPSIDAISEDVFKKINRPINILNYKKILNGLSNFLYNTKKCIYLEIFIVEGINDSQEELAKFVEYLKDKKIAKIQLNTLARPGAVKNIKPASMKRLIEIRNHFINSGLNSVEIIKNFTAREDIPKYNRQLENTILNMLRKRKYDIYEICELLHKNSDEVYKYLNILQKDKKINIIIENNHIYINLIP